MDVSGTSLSTIVADTLAQVLGKEAAERWRLWDPHDFTLTHGSLMLLDFTPDNVFLFRGRALFIDPWLQESYVGHPALSLGQYATLALIYRLSGAEELAIKLHACARQLGKRIKLSSAMSDRAFFMGAGLQMVLSAWARRTSDPAFSQKLISLFETTPNMDVEEWLRIGE